MTKPVCRMRRLCWAVVIGVGVALVGCGVLTARKTEFDAALKNADGQTIFVEDIRAIVHNVELDEAGKVEALGNLGIEDDDLVRSLITLPITAP